MLICRKFIIRTFILSPCNFFNIYLLNTIFVYFIVIKVNLDDMTLQLSAKLRLFEAWRIYIDVNDYCGIIRICGGSIFVVLVGIPRPLAYKF